MRRKREVIEELLKGLSVLEEFHEPPEVVVNQFANWLNNVSSILDGVDMRDESNVWNEGIKGIRFSDDYSLVVAMSTAKAALLRILNKLESTEIFATPHLRHEDITSAYQMSELYIILHCYENSVRGFIEKILHNEFGDNWWEQVANNEIKKRVDDRKKKEEKDKWISPRGE